MPVIAIVNRKGGSGKSTLATHLAAHCAHKGLAVLLGDADFQQSSHAWLRQRERQKLAPRAPKIAGWSVDPRNILRAPPGVTHVILDTPGGLKGYDLARVLMLADAVLMPVCYSLFDRESAADCLVELRTHPRVARGRCKVAAVGMRIDARTKADASLRQWAAARDLPFLGALRETQTYVKCLDHGLTIFDMPALRVQTDLEQWTPLLDWLGPLLQPVDVETKPQRKPSRPVLPPGSSPAGHLRPVAPSAETELLAARTAAGAFDSTPMPLLPAGAGAEPFAALDHAAPRANVHVGGAARTSVPAAANRAASVEVEVEATTAEPESRHASLGDDEDIDSRFGGLTTRIGRWLESLSLKRAR